VLEYSEMKKTHIILFSYFLTFQLCLAGTVSNQRGGNKDAQAPENLDLTDQERFESTIFIHEGKSNRIKKEECAKLENPEACRGDAEAEFLGVDSSTVQMVAKAYTLVLGFMGGTFELKGEASADTAKTTEKKETETTEDYCRFIPIATEAIAFFQQSSGQQLINEAPQTQGSKQKELLFKAAKAHEERAKSAKIQTTGWGAAAACYAVYIASGQVVVDWKVLLKAGASIFLAAFYKSEADAQDGFADEVRKIAEKMPGEGDCNPHTDKACYCAQEETKFDPRHCLPEVHKRPVAESSFRVPCADINAKADGQCVCLSTQSCFGSKFFTDIKGAGFGQFATSPVGRDLGRLVNGELTGANLNGSSSQRLARAKGLLNKSLVGKKIKPAPNSGSAKGARGIEKFGVPKRLAALLASAPTPKGARANLAKFSGLRQGSGNLANVSKKARQKNRELRFSSASGLKGKKSGKKSRNNLSFLKKLRQGKKGKKRGKNKVLKFALEAQKNAQISKRPSASIWNIISRRYIVSGRKRLEID
jgi:hypothetical protein